VAVTNTVTRQPSKSITIARTFPARNDIEYDGDPLTVTAAAAKSNGGVAITLNTTNIIFAASTSTNSDWFTYTVSDGKLTAIGTNIVKVATNGVVIVP
jgi:hypothetical protein